MSYADLFRDARDTLPGRGVAWLDALREESLARFGELGLPTTKLEDWRFTSLAALEERTFEPAPRTSEDPEPEAVSALSDAHRIVFVDGRLAPSLSRLMDLPGGLHVSSLAERIDADPDGSRALIEPLSDPKSRALTALHTAFFADGAVVELDADTSVDRPILLVHARSSTAGVMSSPRTRLAAGAGSRATIVELFAGGPDDPAGSFTNALTEIRLEPNASLDHLRVQDEATGSIHLGGLFARQEAGSRLASASIALGGALSRLDLRSELAGEGADCGLLGLYLAAGRQHVDHHTTVDHATPHCTSHELYKGILAGRSRAVFHGRIDVRPHAQKTDASQTNRNLVLSEGAAVNTKPQLEIHADDVRCSHGASIGRLDADALFFLRSRGINADAARTVLTLAFANDVLAQLPVEPLRDWLELRLALWMEAAR